MDFLEPAWLLRTFGTIGLFAIVFAESGLLFGFFLPGDSLLFTAGLLASQGQLNLPVILVGCFVCAVAGDQVGYAFGRRVGPSLFRRPDARLFKHSHVEKAQGYFDRYGAKTVVLARFVPIVRTFVPFVAGGANMTYPVFAFYNVTGAVAWVGICVGAGYLFGNIPVVKDNFELVVIAIIAVSVLPIVVEVFKNWRRAPGSQEGQA